MKILSLILGSIIVASLLVPISFAEETKMPPQVKDLLDWYTSGQIQYNTFRDILIILIEDNIFQSNQTSTNQNLIKFVDPIKNTLWESVPYTIENPSKNATVTFYGLIPTERTDRFVSDEKYRKYYLKFQYENLLKHERLKFSPMSLENIEILTDKGHYWKFKNYQWKAVPIDFYENHMDPEGKYTSDEHGISIKKDETPKFVHMTMNDTKYIFDAKFVSPWYWKK